MSGKQPKIRIVRKWVKVNGDPWREVRLMLARIANREAEKEKAA